LTKLILNNLIIAAFLAPALTLLISLPTVTQTAERFVQKVVSADYELIWYQEDMELSYVLMFWEYFLMFGFSVPLIMPLICVGLFSNNCVYHCAVDYLSLPTRNATRPSMLYLYIAHMFGLVLIIAIFFDNKLNGKMLVGIGVPLCALAGFVLPRYLQHRRTDQADSTGMLMEPLMDPEQRDMAVVTNVPDAAERETETAA